jgi:hypothetical protein
MAKSFRARLFIPPLLFLLLSLLLRGAPAFAAIIVTNNLPMQIVCCQDGVDVDALIKKYGLSPKYIYRHALNGFAAPMDSATIKKLQSDSRVLTVEADGIVTLADQTIPTGVIRIGANTFPVGRSNNAYLPLNVDVAVLDCGINPNPDLLPSYQTFFSFSSDGSDSFVGTTTIPDGHGTLVTGVIAAQDNSFGVVGVAPGVRIWNVKCTGPAPYNNWNNVILGMDFAIANSSNIAVANIFINNTGTGAPVGAIASAIHAMVRGGIVVVASAGNLTNDLAGTDGVFGTGDDPLPASLPDAMAVSAMDPLTDTFATFSNFGRLPRTNSANSNIAANYVLSPGGTIDVAAPGVNIYTTGGSNNYVTKSGTSFAAPHVAGLVALYIAVNGRATNEWGVYKIRQAIVDNSLPQSQWRTNNTGDPDTNPEPLAMASLNWVPTTLPIATEPASQIICSGNNVSFGVTTCVGAFAYQWLFNGTNLSDDLRITGSVASTLTLTNVSSADAGYYQVVVTDGSGSNTLSSVAMLAILPPSLLQNGSFETPLVVSNPDYPPQPQGYNPGDSVGAWTVESASSQFLVFSNSMTGSYTARTEFNWHPTPAGGQFAQLSDYTLGLTVLRQDLTTPLYAGSNYYVGFLQSGFVDFRAPAQVTVSVAPTGSTNEVFTQTFSVRAMSDWTRQQTYFSVPTNGLYSLRLKSTQGYEALVDDVVLSVAPATVAPPTPPVFQNISRSGSVIALTWSAIAGQTNQLQYKANLSDTNWINAGASITATNAAISTTDSPGPDPQRFYRVMVLP